MAREDGSVGLKLVFGKESGSKVNVTVKKGYRDPRVGTPFEHYISSNEDISLACTYYYQGP